MVKDDDVLTVDEFLTRFEATAMQGEWYLSQGMWGQPLVRDTEQRCPMAWYAQTQLGMDCDNCSVVALSRDGFVERNYVIANAADGWDCADDVVRARLLRATGLVEQGPLVSTKAIGRPRTWMPVAGLVPEPVR